MESVCPSALRALVADVYMLISISLGCWLQMILVLHFSAEKITFLVAVSFCYLQSTLHLGFYHCFLHERGSVWWPFCFHPIHRGWEAEFVAHLWEYIFNFIEMSQEGVWEVSGTNVLRVVGHSNRKQNFVKHTFDCSILFALSQTLSLPFPYLLRYNNQNKSYTFEVKNGLGLWHT